MIRRLLFACLVAALFTVTLNARNLEDWGARRLSVASLNDSAIDERLYFSTIAKTGQGAPPLGHSSYIEHRADAVAMSLAPVIEGLPMRWLGLSLEHTLLLGDLLWPLLTILLLTLGLLSLFPRSPLIAGATAFLIGGDIGTYFLRASNPQLPFVGSAAWFAAAMMLPAEGKTALLLRGAIVGALSWLHPLYASFFVIADVSLLLGEFLRRRSWKKTLVSSLRYALAVIAFLIPRFLLSASPEAAADTLARAGVIFVRIPAAPQLQMMLLAVAAVITFLWWRKKRWPSERMRFCIVLIAASLLALNQSLIHGIDATFVSYYNNLIRTILILSAAVVAVHVVRPVPERRALFLCVAGLSLLTLWNALGVFSAAVRVDAERYTASDIPKVLTWLRERPDGPFAVAAPNAINERIPYETPHYVLFNEYGWNQQMTDRELAERYALQVNLIPSSKARDRTYTFVFGGYAGLTSAKRRALCRIKRTLLGTVDPCTLDARTLIRHQELLPIVDNADVDVPEMMEKYHVGYIVTEKPHALPPRIRVSCAKATTIGTYAVWSCHVVRERHGLPAIVFP